MPDSPVPSPQVFISYHSGDAEWVRRLAEALRERNISVWLDQDEIRAGDAFPRALERALEAVSCVVFVVSSGSMRSRWVREEYDRALVRANSPASSLQLIAVLIGDADRPPGFMASRTFVDFRDPGAFTRAADTLAAAIARQQPPADGFTLLRGVDRGDEDVPVDYVKTLETFIGRTRAAITRFFHIRVGGACVGGVSVGGIVAAAGMMGLVVGPATVYVALPLTGALFMGLVAWAATLREVAKCRRDLRGFEMLRDGLTTCGSRTLPACDRLRAAFWTTVEREVKENLRGARELSG